MANFTNYATLSYSGGTTNSNTVTGEILETISAAKTAVFDQYTANDDVTYVISLVNSDAVGVDGLTVTDNLGGYPFGGEIVYPLACKEGSIRCYVNGVLQPAPAATAGPPLLITGIHIPAGGNVTLIYEAELTGYAPLAPGAEITNTASVTGAWMASPVTAQAAITPADRVELTVSKAVSPAVVSPNGQLTYTFVIENTGNTGAAADENAVLTDTFNPILSGLAVSRDGMVWTPGAQYTYNETTGVFSTLPGQITVPAATYTQGPDGIWIVTPGTTILTVTGSLAAAVEKTGC